jgi:hypothetical protein
LTEFFSFRLGVEQWFSIAEIPPALRTLKNRFFKFEFKEVLEVV